MNDTAPEQNTEETPSQEFSSVILTIDHTSTRKDDHVVQKFVASTQPITETMLALFEYYDESHLLHSASTIHQFQVAGSNPASAFVYRTRENVQVVLTAEAFETMVAALDGSVFQATNYLCNAAGELIVESQKAAGGVVPLLLLSFSYEETFGALDPGDDYSEEEGV